MSERVKSTPIPAGHTHTHTHIHTYTLITPHWGALWTADKNRFSWWPLFEAGQAEHDLLMSFCFYSSYCKRLHFVLFFVLLFYGTISDCVRCTHALTAEGLVSVLCPLGVCKRLFFCPIRHSLIVPLGERHILLLCKTARKGYTGD